MKKENFEELKPNQIFLNADQYKPHHTPEYSKDVLTHTLDAISRPAVSTATFKASRYIDAGSMHVAVMSPDLTLINIWTDNEWH